ncbi:4Fe-4S binding protein [Anaerotignum sp. MB30-C6]|uniref:4Fe-4S binding protein n=1 Tax=Anaerotignum sp. MB30-C6 TaxID=3070814 RepID=UPI0027DBB915|nr:4Fe-4S binding protein [Anaerotignum sp. MB30-C6]WMI80328.1 4Fe-4S binding protein [Anaerotignum sp. MB30-C6]
MIRRIIEINQDKCNGCGLCATACHEGAIAMIDGKAQLIRDDYCDGLGDCLPTCPTGAIQFVEREALPYDEEAVKKNMAAKAHACSCPGSQSRTLQPQAVQNSSKEQPVAGVVGSQLRQWPVQIQLAPIQAPYFDGANLLIAADCSAYAYGDFHNKFMKNKVTLIGCPKLDMADYAEKLQQIIMQNDIKSVTVVRMQVPCCGGIEMAVKTALQNSGKFLPWQIVTISTQGEIIA